MIVYAVYIAWSIVFSSLMKLTNLGDKRTAKLSGITEQLEDAYGA